MRLFTNQRTKFVLVLILVLLSMLITNIPSSVSALSTIIAGCPKLPKVGNRVPVIMVPGFGGKASAAFYQSGGLQDTLNKVPGIYADSTNGIDTFDYSAHPADWVDKAGTGQALEMKIACMAQSSRERGGPGKVILIGYSMGGLLVRYAVNQTLPDGHAVADDVGYIINVAVPNGGVDLASVGFGLFQEACAFKSFPLNGMLFQPGKQALADNCPLLPDIKDFETSLNSPTNKLPHLPVSIPVYDIEGNVRAPLSFFFQSFPLLGTDLLVSVYSAHSEENTLSNGLGGDLVVQCTALTPVLYFSGADCDHLGISHYAPMEKEVMTQIEKYIGTLPSPCPTNAGTCLGVRSGDVDGDGKPDQVGVTYTKGSCSFLGCTFSNLTIHVVLANGGVINYPVPLSANMDTQSQGPITDPKFVGLTDMDGDGKVEIVLTYNDCVDGCDYWAYELLGDQMQRLPFYGYSQSRYGLQQAFKCSVVNGAYQVTTTYGFQVPGESHPAITYQADGKGGMRYVGQHMVTIQQTNQEGLTGPNCPGLTS